MRQWDPDATLTDLAADRTLDGWEDNPGEAARQIFRRNAAIAASAITHLAIHAPNEKVRLDAAKYVIERNLGRVGDAAHLLQEDTPLERLIREMTQPESEAS